MIRPRSVEHTDPAGSAPPRRIALIGVDGSGKTTQAHRLAAALEAAGRPADYWQNAGGRRWFGRLARRLGRRDAQRLLGRHGMLLAELVLRWLAIARALVRSALRRRIAVMDRYAVCQYASIRAHRGGRRWERVARAAYRLFPPADVTFLLAVDPERAYERIETRGTDHERLTFLLAADTAYRALPELPSFVIIDGNGTPDEVSQAIVAHLAPRFAAAAPGGPKAGPGGAGPGPGGAGPGDAGPVGAGPGPRRSVDLLAPR
jgi:thymidylate kinase